MVLCSRAANKGQNGDSLSIETPKSTGKQNGRTYCACPGSFFKITVVAGAIIGIIGGLFLLSLFLPNAGPLTHVFQNVSAFVGKVALKLGSDATALSIFVASVGATVTFVGIAGWAADSCRHQENENALKLQKNPNEEQVDSESESEEEKSADPNANTGSTAKTDSSTHQKEEVNKVNNPPS